MVSLGFGNIFFWPAACIFVTEAVREAKDGLEVKEKKKKKK